MKTTQKPKEYLAIVATLLLLLAIPISIVGTQQVNDLRRHAGEDTSKLHFVTDFTKAEFRTAYIGEAYQKTIDIAGTNAANATITLGCDESKCGSLCDNIQHTPPEGLRLIQSPNVLVWNNPQKQGTKATFPITLSVTAPISQASSTEYECAVASFNLTVSQHQTNQPPSCQITNGLDNLTKIPTGQAIPFILSGSDNDDGIASVSASFTQAGGTPSTKTWQLNGEKNVVINKDSSPALVFTPTQQGSYSISGQITDKSGVVTQCSRGHAGGSINIVIPGENGAPIFTTDPYANSVPSTTLTVGQHYSYTVEGRDPDGNPITYYIINQTGWLNYTPNIYPVGQYRGVFSGTPTQPGSYTVAVAINDGFHNHYTTQIWVINVSSATNDNPVVRVTLPARGSVYKQHQNIRIQWTATDRNLIKRFDVYLATNPADQTTWKLIGKNIGYHYNALVWNTNSTAPGTYYIIVKATDNQTPAGVGIGISGAFTIKEGNVTPPPPPPCENCGGTVIPESYPRILNIHPSNNSKITELKPLISADIFASSGKVISKGSISLKLDDEDITSLTQIKGEDKNEGSAVFQPEEPLSYGSHKVVLSFKDSAGKAADKTWTFTIEKEQQEKPSTPSDVITILGFKIPRRIALIVIIGLALLLLAIMIPWLFYAAWRKSQDEEEEEYGYYPSENLPRSPLQTKSVTNVYPTEVRPIEPKETTSGPVQPTPEKTTEKVIPWDIPPEETTVPAEPSPQQPVPQESEKVITPVQTWDTGIASYPQEVTQISQPEPEKEMPVQPEQQIRPTEEPKSTEFTPTQEVIEPQVIEPQPTTPPSIEPGLIQTEPQVSREQVQVQPEPMRPTTPVEPAPEQPLPEEPQEKSIDSNQPPATEEEVIEALKKMSEPEQVEPGLKTEVNVGETTEPQTPPPPQPAPEQPMPPIDSAKPASINPSQITDIDNGNEDNQGSSSMLPPTSPV